MEEKEIFVMDTETGGFNARTDGLCSIALKVFDKDIKELIYIKPNVDLRYSQEAMNVNGLSLEYLEENGLDENEAINKIKTFIITNFNEKPEILGHNVQFDNKFIEALFERNNVGSFMELIHYHFNDSMVNMKMLNRSGATTCENAKLGTSYTYFTGEEPENAHDAMGDVLMTETLFKEQLKFMEKK